MLFCSEAQAVEPESSSLSFVAETGSTAYRAVFAQYLAVIPSANPAVNVDCAISISNVCAAPSVLSPFIGGSTPLAPSSGRVSLFLYNTDGTLLTYTTAPDSPGYGLNPDGTLSAGMTWTVRLAEVLSKVLDRPENQIDFRGYGWILSEFDCLAGTYNNTVFGVGFTQSYEMVPAMGQGGFFGGVMIPPQ